VNGLKSDSKKQVYNQVSFYSKVFLKDKLDIRTVFGLISYWT